MGLAAGSVSHSVASVSTPASPLVSLHGDGARSVALRQEMSNA